MKKSETNHPISKGCGDELLFEVYGSFFTRSKENLKMSEVKNFREFITFPSCVKKEFFNINNRQVQDLEKKLEKINQFQRLLPLSQRSKDQYILIEQEIKDLKYQKDFVISKGIRAEIQQDKYMIVYGGRHIKFAKLKAINKKRPLKHVGNWNDFKFETKNGIKFYDISSEFGPLEEIRAISQTCIGRDENIYQTISDSQCQLETFDWEHKIKKIITWDIEKNSEISMLQIKAESPNDEGHLIKGMCEKMNYYFSHDSIIDLEYNIPLLQSNLKQNIVLNQSYDKQISRFKDIKNQNKLYYEKTRFLGIETPNVLYFTLTKLDIIKWIYIHESGNDPEDITNLMTLDDMNLNFSGCSLFHKYASDPDVIQVFYDRYMNDKRNDTLSCCSINLPLQIVNPNNLQDTALQISYKLQQPRSLEIMLLLLIDMPTNALSRMFLSVFPIMLAHESENIYGFFNTCFFQPLQMRLPLYVPWETDDQECIFACHTSIMSQYLVMDKLRENGITDDLVISQEYSLKCCEHKHTAQQDFDKISQFRPIDLKEMTQKLEKFQQKQLKKVQIQCLDLDWLFYGDNAAQLLQILAKQANPEVLGTEVIRIFIELMWRYYQPKIRNCILIPYMLYLMLSIYVTASVVDQYHNFHQIVDNNNGNLTEHESLHIQVLGSYYILGAFLIFNTCLELRQGLQQGGIRKYMSDYWNQIDILSLSLNAYFLYCFRANVLASDEDEDVYQKRFIKIIGAFAVFFMWIKVFYWMRLFPSLAYYVKLIQATIQDSFNFSKLVFIILLSFASFYYVIDIDDAYEQSDDDEAVSLKASAGGGQGIPGEQSTEFTEEEYIRGITGYKGADALIDVYLMGAIGDFDLDMYKVGYQRYAALGMFLLCTMLVTVVFMNMLIAIMGQTFSDVQESEQINGMLERVELINDFIWLVNLEKTFKGQKYIIQVKPLASYSNQEEENDQKFDQLGTQISKIIKDQHYQMESQMRENHKIQIQAQNKLNRKIKGLERVQAFKMKNDQYDQQDQTSVQLNKTFGATNNSDNTFIADQKCVDFIFQLYYFFKNKQFVPTDSNIYEYTLTWIEAVDFDQNGKLSIDEFYESILLLEDFYMSDNEFKYMFNLFDGPEGSGELSVSELAKGVKLLCNKENISDAGLVLKYSVQQNMLQRSSPTDYQSRSQLIQHQNATKLAQEFGSKIKQQVLGGK